MSVELLEGSDALAHAMVSAGCRFFAGYPMTPFTEVLEGMARLLPDVGGDCVNAESELEAIGMAWGAAAAGLRAATGSVGQGLSLMQESIAELCFARVPMVVLNMARGQGDYYQATRGGGHGDYRTVVLAPAGIAEAVTLIQQAFHIADLTRNPVMFMGDYYLAHVIEAVETGPADFGALPANDWMLDGSTSGTGNARILSSIMTTKRNAPVWVNYGQYLETSGAKIAGVRAAVPPMYEAGWCEDADYVVAAYGTPARIVRYVVGRMRERGVRVGFFRPITLWPFPKEALVAATRSARAIGVYELNAGQMIDDVLLSVRDREAESIGGLSFDSSGFGVAPELTPEKVEARISAAMARLGQEIAA
ncbi:thiamine pyrophosphate-binding protein [Sphingomonas bacterium]|uniref:thiamine pyrophosphate-binding protein n=1 Tax=Sphingomonas bacterium TaxID=1895847 RepID=UPI001575C1E0|nr:thiamine pyrophosphate-binding protein [Sphingomonas bacterium]